MFIRENVALLNKFYEKYNVPSNVCGCVPTTFIEGRYFWGFNQKIGKEIEDYILNLQKETPSPGSSNKREIKIPLNGNWDLSDRWSNLFCKRVFKGSGTKTGL